MEDAPICNADLEVNRDDVEHGYGKAAKAVTNTAILLSDDVQACIEAPMHTLCDVTPKEALQEYCQRFGELPQEDLLGFNRSAFPWANVKSDTKTKAAGLRMQVLELEKEMLGVRQNPEPPKMPPTQQDASPVPRFELKGWAEDSDGDDVRICAHCNLPIGDNVYNRGRDCVHGECMAQLMVQDLQVDEKSLLRKERAKKDQIHASYGIGWEPSKQAPRNDIAASKLALRSVPQGMVCLVLDEETASIHIAATREPSAAMNLDYLSTALQVRRTEGHEPIFSLDPVDADEKNSMQEKVYTPDWLAGTSAGEVLFQSDYHLKELSMGDAEQPVVGMKSCFEWSAIENNKTAWRAREWFLVRKAEVQITDMNMLIPLVKMGVEAREQLVKGARLSDVPITRPNHPMVKYAESFTHNFELIAERKSVVFHLRELAKASVMAKYLLESRANLHEDWFNLAESREVICSLEVPQLWNERTHSEVHIEDGSVKDQHMHTHGVYGGVRFGLDKFNLSTSVPVGRAAAVLTAGKPFLTRGAAARTPSFMPAVARAGMQMSSAQVAEAGSLRLSGVVSPTAPTAAAGLQLKPLALSGARMPLRAPAGLQMQVPLAASGLVSAAATAQLPAARPSFEEAFRLPSKAGMLPVSNIVSLASGAQFAPPSPGLAGPSLPAARLGAALSAASIAAPRLAAAMLAPGQAVPGQPPLKGVDLRLDQFDLSEAKRVSLEAQSGNWDGQVKPLDECIAVGDAFFAGLDGTDKIFKEEDQALLVNIFNPLLSDRRREGDLFVPPAAGYSQVHKLRALIKEEEAVRERRKQVFFSQDFVMASPGPLFPHSWTSSHAIAQPTQEGRPVGTLIPRPEYKDQSSKLWEHLKVAAPVFDKSTEEGLQFRIYRLGSLEVRTTQELQRNEMIGAVFSICTATLKACMNGPLPPDWEQQKIIKASSFVESTSLHGNVDSSILRCKYYLVLETDSGGKILTERLQNGNLSWVENPEDLAERNSLAKSIRAETCSIGTTVRDMLDCRAKLASNNTSLSSKRYVKLAFARASGSKRNNRPTYYREITASLPECSRLD